MTAGNETTTYTYGTGGNGQMRLTSESNGCWTRSHLSRTDGHELIHAGHNYAIPSDLFVKADSEKVAYKYTFDVLLDGGYSELAIKKMMIAIANNYYGYAPINYYSSLYYLGF